MITAIKQTKQLLKKQDLNYFIGNEQHYHMLIKKLEKIILGDFRKRKTIVSVTINDVEYNMKLSNLYTQLVLLYPFVHIYGDGVIPDDFIVIDEIGSFNSSFFNGYCNQIIKFIGLEKKDELNVSLKWVIETLSDISGRCNKMHGTTINIYDIIHLSMTDKEVAEAIRYSIPANLEFKEIEDDIDKNFKKFLNVLEKHETCYSIYLKSKTGINLKQFCEKLFCIGLKPDLEGMIIPETIDTNFTMGLRNITDFFINACGARKALITSHERVKDSGYLTRKLILLLIDTTLSEIDDCQTDEFVELFIENEQTLNRVHARYYYDENTNETILINSDTDRHLIGETIQLRSPIKCKCEDGKVCRTCYGDLSYANEHLHIGVLGVLYLTAQLTQILLSTKHLLKTKSGKIEWDENFQKFFIVDKNNVMLNDDVKGIELIIDHDNIESEDGIRYIEKFKVSAKEGKTKKIYDINSPIKLTITPDLELRLNGGMGDDIYVVKQKYISDLVCFNYRLENKELSSSLESIQDLIESSDHLGLTNIDDIVNTFVSLLNESGIKIQAIHIELIIRCMIRDINNQIFRPERFDDENEYTVLKVSDAITKSQSPSVGLAFERVKQQLQSADIYLKDGKSSFDYLFM